MKTNASSVPRKQSSSWDPLVDPAVIAYWFEGIRIRLGQKRPYGVEKLVEPEVFKRCKSGYSHNNKWRGYKAGVCVPSHATLQKAEAICPGSTQAFGEPFWIAARTMAGPQIGNQADALLRRLPLDLLRLFFRVDPKTGGEVRRGVTDRTTRLLSRRVDLNGVTALSVVIREAAEKHQYKLVMRSGEALFELILRLATVGDERHQILLPMILDLLRDRVLPFVQDRTHRFCLDGLDSVAFCALPRWAIEQHVEHLSSLGQQSKIGMSDLNWARRLILPSGWLTFSFPTRPLKLTGRWREDEENYQLRIAAWEEAIALMRGGAKS